YYPYIRKRDNNDAVMQPLIDEWNETRGKDTRDSDSLELVRAHVMLNYCLQGLFGKETYHRNLSWMKEVLKEVKGDVKLTAPRYERHVSYMVDFLMKADAPAQAPDFLLDLLEYSLAVEPQAGESKAAKKAAVSK